jgi:hypothetical protein
MKNATRKPTAQSNEEPDQEIHRSKHEEPNQETHRSKQQKA